MKTISTPLEEQVPNLEICKKLQEVLNGFEVEFETIHSHCCVHVPEVITSESIRDADDIYEVWSDSAIFQACRIHGVHVSQIEKVAPAPLLTELWRLLPYDIETKDGIDWETKELSWLSVGYTNLIHFANKTNIAQATAELLIWVAESHPEQLKQHLEVL